MRPYLPIAAILGMLASPALTAAPPAPPHDQHSRDVACVPAEGRQDQLGCWIIATLPMDATAESPLFWHVYELPVGTEPAAADLAGSLAVPAYGRKWLFMVADRDWRPGVGRHVATVGPMLPLTSGPHTASFSAAMFEPGMRSRIHTHPGPEAWVVLEGEQCLETPEGIIRGAAGDSMMVRGGIPMALFGTGTGTRRALVVILHPTGELPGKIHDKWQPTGSCLAG
jgi:quercetin dioxygenase-like cupin family protein